MKFTPKKNLLQKPYFFSPITRLHRDRELGHKGGKKACAGLTQLLGCWVAPDEQATGLLETRGVCNRISLEPHHELQPFMSCLQTLNPKKKTTPAASSPGLLDSPKNRFSQKSVFTISCSLLNLSLSLSQTKFLLTQKQALPLQAIIHDSVLLHMTHKIQILILDSWGSLTHSIHRSIGASRECILRIFQPSVS
jgi:hypothetical protein